MTIEQKAKLYDDIVWWIDVSVGWWNDKVHAAAGLESILEYTLWVYCASQISPEDIIMDWDTDTPGGEYTSETRWMLACIDKESWMYWYKSAQEILSPNKK